MKTTFNYFIKITVISKSIKIILNNKRFLSQLRLPPIISPISTHTITSIILKIINCPSTLLINLFSKPTDTIHNINL